MTVTPTKSSRTGRRSSPLERAVTQLRRAPLTVVTVLALWALGWGTSSLLSGPPSGLRQVVGLGVTSLSSGRWWSPLSSGLWCSGLISYLGTTAMLLLLVGSAEVRIGSGRTAILLVTTQAVGGAAGVGVIALGAHIGEPWSAHLATDLTTGPSIAATGVALAASGGLDALWRRRIRVVILVGLTMLALYSGSLQDVLRLAGGVLGLALATPVSGRPRRGPALGASAPETRTLVALVVAACAVGPLIAAVSGTAIGPLSVLRLLVMSSPPDLAAVHASCADPAGAEDCLSLRYRLRLGGVGPAIMSILPALLLLVLADGLRHGRRIAWWGALGINALFAVVSGMLAVITAASPVERLIAFGGAGEAQFRTGVLVSVAQPLAMLVLLIATRARYRIDAPPAAYRRWATVLGVAFLADSAIFLVGSHVCRRGFTPTPGWAELWADLPTRFLPPGYLGEVEISFLPLTPPATVFYDWTGPTFWCVAIAASLWVDRRTRVVTGDADLARELITTHGGSTLAWLSTWAGNSYWSHTCDPCRKGGQAVPLVSLGPCVGVAYRVIGGIAITTGEPFGDLKCIGGAIEGFARFCAENAWTPCFYSVGAPTRGHIEALGWHSLQVAEETIVLLDGLAFTGKKWQDVRSAFNNAARGCITHKWLNYRHASVAVSEQVRSISEEWVADKRLPEMGFTLGGLAELADDHVRCVIAIDADGKVHGITSWLPIYQGGELIGWTLDFMRRRATSFRGVMEFLIATAALRFQQEGARLLSLSGAPLARLERGDHPHGLQKLLDASGRALEPVYGFRSLLAFKAKFQPEYRPLYMVYPDAAALPAIATAIGRAYLPDLDPERAILLLRGLRRSRRAIGRNDRTRPLTRAARLRS